MKINNIILPSYNSTDGLSVDIFLAGCSRSPHCKNCHNSSLWDFDNGQEIDIRTTLSWLKIKEWQYDNIAILGGEPLSQNIRELNQLISCLLSLSKPIWLYTSYELEDVSEVIKENCDYIKTGRFIEELKTEDNISYGIKLATSNQRINKRGLDY